MKGKLLANLLVALAAASIAMGWSVKMALVHSMEYGLFAFLSTFCVYNYQTISTDSRDNMLGFKSLLLINLPALGAGFVLCFYLLLNVEALCLLILATLMSIFYCYPLKKWRLRNVPYLKGPLVAFIWTSLIFVFPLLNESVCTQHNLLNCFSAFFFFWSLIILVDMRDLKEDAVSLRTIPQCLGWGSAKALAFLFVAQFHLITANFNENSWNNSYMHALFVLTYGLILSVNDKRKAHFYLFVDVVLLLLGAVFYFESAF